MQDICEIIDNIGEKKETVHDYLRSPVVEMKPEYKMKDVFWD